MENRKTRKFFTCLKHKVVKGPGETLTFHNPRHGVIKKVTIINCNFITFSKIIECNCD